MRFPFLFSLVVLAVPLASFARAADPEVKKAWSEAEIRQLIREEVAAAVKVTVRDAVREALAELPAKTPIFTPAASVLYSVDSCGQAGQTGSCASQASAGAYSVTGYDSGGRQGLLARFRSRRGGCGR